MENKQHLWKINAAFVQMVHYETFGPPHGKKYQPKSLRKGGYVHSQGGTGTSLPEIIGLGHE